MAKMEGVQRTYLMKEIDRIQGQKLGNIPVFEKDTPQFQRLALLALANVVRCISLKKGTHKFDFGYHYGDNALSALVRNSDKFDINEKDFTTTLAKFQKAEQDFDLARQVRCNKVVARAYALRRDTMLGDNKEIAAALIAFEKEVF
jgi:hypothetical protein